MLIVVSMSREICIRSLATDVSWCSASMIKSLLGTADSSAGIDHGWIKFIDQLGVCQRRKNKFCAFCYSVKFRSSDDDVTECIVSSRRGI